MSNIVKYAGYSCWFVVCLVAFIYLTFPINSVKGRVETELEKALGHGKQGKHGVNPDVTIDKLSLWRLSGVSAKRVQVQLGSTNPDPGASFMIDEARGRVGIFSLLFGSPAGTFDIDAYGGNIAGDLSVGEPFKKTPKGQKPKKSARKNYQLKTLDADIKKIDLAKIPAVQEKARVPVTGLLEGTIDLDLGAQPDKEANGDVDLKIANVNLGPGVLAIPLPGLTGGLTIPSINMGNVVARLNMDKGKATSDRVGVAGKDFNANIDLEMTLNRLLKMSQVKGEGWFKIEESFLETNGKMKTILELASPLKKVKNDEGQYEFNMSGRINKPRFKLGKSSSSRRKSKKK